MERTGEHFVPPKIDMAEKLKNTLGIHGGPPVDVHLRFAADVQQFILERVGHPDQKLEVLPSGEVDVFLRVPITPELHMSIGY